MYRQHQHNHGSSQQGGGHRGMDGSSIRGPNLSDQQADAIHYETDAAAQDFHRQQRAHLARSRSPDEIASRANLLSALRTGGPRAASPRPEQQVYSGSQGSTEDSPKSPLLGQYSQSNPSSGGMRFANQGQHRGSGDSATGAGGSLALAGLEEQLAGMRLRAALQQQATNSSYEGLLAAAAVSPRLGEGAFSTSPDNSNSVQHQMAALEMLRRQHLVQQQQIRAQQQLQLEILRLQQAQQASEEQQRQQQRLALAQMQLQAELDRYQAASSGSHLPYQNAIEQRQAAQATLQASLRARQQQQQLQQQQQQQAALAQAQASLMESLEDYQQSSAQLPQGPWRRSSQPRQEDTSAQNSAPRRKWSAASSTSSAFSATGALGSAAEIAPVASLPATSVALGQRSWRAGGGAVSSGTYSSTNRSGSLSGPTSTSVSASASGTNSPARSGPANSLSGRGRGGSNSSVTSASSAAPSPRGGGMHKSGGGSAATPPLPPLPVMPIIERSSTPAIIVDDSASEPCSSVSPTMSGDGPDEDEADRHAAVSSNRRRGTRGRSDEVETPETSEDDLFVATSPDPSAAEATPIASSKIGYDPNRVPKDVRRPSDSSLATSPPNSLMLEPVSMQQRRPSFGTQLSSSSASSATSVASNSPISPGPNGGLPSAPTGLKAGGISSMPPPSTVPSRSNGGSTPILPSSLPANPMSSANGLTSHNGNTPHSNTSSTAGTPGTRTPGGGRAPSFAGNGLPGMPSRAAILEGLRTSGGLAPTSSAASGSTSVTSTPALGGSSPFLPPFVTSPRLGGGGNTPLLGALSGSFSGPSGIGPPLTSSLMMPPPQAPLAGAPIMLGMGMTSPPTLGQSSITSPFLGSMNPATPVLGFGTPLLGGGSNAGVMSGTAPTFTPRLGSLSSASGTPHFSSSAQFSGSAFSFASSAAHTPVGGAPIVYQPSRQPKGPPTEFLPTNFVARMNGRTRKEALSKLMGSVGARGLPGRQNGATPPAASMTAPPPLGLGL